MCTIRPARKQSWKDRRQKKAKTGKALLTQLAISQLHNLPYSLMKDLDDNANNRGNPSASNVFTTHFTIAVLARWI